jgi:putative PEP-CTERM system histidine kinase
VSTMVGLWSHALAAVAFTVLTLWQVRQPEGGMQRRMLMLAFGLTAFWATAVAWSDPLALAAASAETARNLGWFGFMVALLLGGRGDERRPAILMLYAVLAAVTLGQCAMNIAQRQLSIAPPADPVFLYTTLILRMATAIGALVLVHNLYTAAAPEARWGIRLPMIALAAMWVYDLNLYTVSYLSQGWSWDLLWMRGAIMLLLVPLFALASRRNAKWRMRLSRTVAFQSLSLMAIGFYFVAMVIVARAIQFFGGTYAPLAQVTVVFGMSVAALVLLPSGRVRAWLKVKVAKHLFQHRYDYRVEWMRFTDTLGRPGEGAAPLNIRVIQAVADIADSPGGLLLLPDEHGGLAAVSRWNWATVDMPATASDALFLRHVEESSRIVELDTLRKGRGSPGEAEVVPRWMLEEPRAWAAVPLVHIDRLTGVVLLERPRVDRTLDWEDFDLFRIAGRQVASYLAEARGQEALSDARRFDEFNRRFAFIMHDIKNLVSQLSLVARNAERHADNPEFRADMIATLQNSVGKMNDLLARLSQHNKSRAEDPRPTALRDVVEAVVASKRVLHPITLEGRSDIVAMIDPARLEQALGHIVQNAIDASPPASPVWISISRETIEARIEVLDHGSGMSSEFMRARLFKPFSSTKEGGFGIGAFEARSLIAAMGGRVDVESREGEGSRFTIIVPLADVSTLPLGLFRGAA